MGYSSNESLLTTTSITEWLGNQSTRYPFSTAQLALILNSTSVFFNSGFSLACIAISAGWLIWRAYLVLRKPLDELVNHLGFDFPQAPQVDVAGIEADCVHLHWKPADERKSSNKYEVHVNGESTGTIASNESTFTVARLCSDCNYIIRVSVVTTADIRASSEPVRIRTKPTSLEVFRLGATSEEPDAKGPPHKPLLLPFRGLPETSPTAPSAPMMARENSNGPTVHKRNITARRPSPGAIINDMQLNALNDVAMSTAIEDSQQRLAGTLEEIGQEIRETDRVIGDDDREASSLQVELLQKRDEARLLSKDREAISKDLKKQISMLDREGHTANNKRATQEGLLQSRRDELRKAVDDTARWTREAQQMRIDIESRETLKVAQREESEKGREHLRRRLDDEALEIKKLEDEVRERSQYMKQLDRETSTPPANGESMPHSDQRTEHDDEEDRSFNEKMQYFSALYREAHDALEAARRTCHEAAEMATRSRNMPSQQVPYTASRNVSRHNSVGHRHISSEQSHTDSSLLAGYASTSNSAFNNTLDTAGPMDTFGPHNHQPIFNTANGMLIDTDLDHLNVPHADVERLTGGAPMSPSVGAGLLPAGLLSTADEEPPTRLLTGPIDLSTRQASGEGVLPGLGAFSGSIMLPGLGVSNVPQTDFTPQGPASPASVSSKSPSLFASPRASNSNLAFQTDTTMDADGRSIRSGRSIRPTSGGQGSRFAQILGLARGKSGLEDPLSLGRVQSHSMPKDAGLDDHEFLAKRRNSSHGTNIFGNLRAARGGNKSTDGATDEAETAMSPQRKALLSISGRDGWNTILGRDNRPGSPRQGSTHSTELPRPTEQNQRWGFWPSGKGTETSDGASLETGWSSTTRPSRIWGRTLSQRATNSVSFDIKEDDDDEDVPPRSLPQAPIGTKRSVTIERPVTPNKLNPAAKDFKSLFNGKKDKAEKSGKGKSKDGNLAPSDAALVTPRSSAPSPLLQAQDDDSPPPSRRSRDERSVTTAESSGYETLSRTSLDRTPSHQVMDAATPTSSVAGSSSKGSFMRKLSRKGSSGKFSLPGFPRDKKQRTAEKTLDEEAQEAGDGQAGSETPSKSIEIDRDERRFSRNWSSVFTKSKGKERAKDPNEREKTPSVSEASLTSTSEAAERD